MKDDKYYYIQNLYVNFPKSVPAITDLLEWDGLEENYYEIKEAYVCEYLYEGTRYEIKI